MPNITDDKRYDALFDKSMDLASTLASTIMIKCKEMRQHEEDSGVVHALNGGMAVLAGAIRPLAVCMAGPDKESHPTQDHYLFAAILTALCCNPSEDGKSLTFNYGPDIIGDAMDFMERATGRKLDGVLPPPMVQAAREMQKLGSDTFKAFMDGRANQPDPKPAA